MAETAEVTSVLTNVSTGMSVLLLIQIRNLSLAISLASSLADRIRQVCYSYMIVSVEKSSPKRLDALLWQTSEQRFIAFVLTLSTGHVVGYDYLLRLHINALQLRRGVRTGKN